MISDTKRSIWLESFDDLVDRWRDLEDNPYSRLPKAADIASRVRRRVGLLLRQCSIPQLEDYDYRLWATRHEAAVEERRLRDALARFGWNAVVTEGKAGRHTAMVQPGAIDANVVLIHREDSDALAAEFRRLEVPVDFAPVDAVLLTLAEELFHIAARDLGDLPKEPWVDELALPLFCQYILAWPICPLARTVLLARGT